jgi:tetratricopeptide (TPR) repeat protein
MVCRQTTATPSVNSPAFPATVEGPISSRRWGVPLAVGLIVLTGVAVYWNSFAGVFLFDDFLSIVENPTIRQWYRLDQVLCPPAGNMIPIAGRPIMNLSLAINYAISGTQTWSYHLVNLLLHLANGLLLFDVLRRTFQRPVVRSSLGDHALPLATVIAVLWTVHPLHTEAVTYISERAESLVAMFFLLTLYGVLRSEGSPRACWWEGMSVVSCLLGMASKELMVTAPVVVLIYDRCFLSGSLKEAWRRRWRFYVLLASTWILLVGLVLSAGVIFRHSEVGVHPRWLYALTEPQAILHYLRLAVWPRPLCADYGYPVSTSWCDILPSLLAVLACGIFGVWALVKRPQWGFLGLWFFGILAPTSSVVPTLEVIVERRMYLPLAAVLILLVVGTYLGGRAAIRQGWLTSRAAAVAGVCLVLVVGATWGVLTVERNGVYSSELGMWQDIVAKAPENVHANYRLGFVLFAQQRYLEGLEYCERAIQLNRRPNATVIPKIVRHNEAMIACQCGMALANMGRRHEAIERYKQAIQAEPEMVWAHYNCGFMLAELGRASEAIAHYQEALRVKPDYLEVHNNWGSLLLSMGRTAEALDHYQKSLRIASNPTAHNNLGMILQANGRLDEAADHFRQAVRLRPDYVRAQFNLVLTLAQMGRVREAIETGSQADKSLPDQWQVKAQVAWLLATHDPADGGDPYGALELAERAVTLSGRREVVCLETLAAACASAGRFEDAMVVGVEAGRLAQSTGQKALLARIEKQLYEYRNRKPYRESLVGSKP